MSDGQEIQHGTDPEYRDTDFDGLRDRIELGLSGETDSYTIWDTNQSIASRFESLERNLSVNASQPLGTKSNDDADSGRTTTNPLNRDNDTDGNPDGCLDGWGYGAVNDEFGLFNETGDLIHNFWEGEDLDLDGEVDTGPWVEGPGGGETNGSIWDSDLDGMPDGWEAWYGINPLDSTYLNGAEGEKDDMAFYNTPWDFQNRPGGLLPDGLPNYYEYIAGTNPRLVDTDFDNASDGLEANSTILRTDVPNGAWKFDAYEQTNLSGSTIQFREKLYNYSQGRNWTELVPLDITLFGGKVATETYIKFFDEQSYICLNKTTNEIQVTEM
jgi:hypothetical protein